MQVTLGDNDALLQLHLTGRPNELAGAGTFHMAALADRASMPRARASEPETSTWSALQHRAQDRDIGHFLLGPTRVTRSLQANWPG